MMSPLTTTEQEHLLGRRVEHLLDDDDRAGFRGRRCLITGAAGSIGSELARTVAACAPAHLTLVDQSEYGLFRLQQQLREQSPSLSFEVALADVTRPSSMARVVGRSRPEFVFHAAAYKHVSMAETAACAAARVNVLGTAEVLAALQQTEASFVLVSSDKAASPRGVMGATKRLAELVTLASESPMVTPMVVRFGNVLASSGSFVELMQERVARGQSVVLTDPDAYRYFMALSEAVALLMKVALARRPGAYWLDMGQQLQMGPFASRLLSIMETRGARPVPVDIIGLRPGEKLVEELPEASAGHVPTPHARIRAGEEVRWSRARAASVLTALRRAVDHEDAGATLRILGRAVAGFEPSVQAWSQARPHEHDQRERTARSA
jgi:FlaA1/EpsC-like NDP-sugar epimerase